MLGCKLQREKCYRSLAHSLNNHYKVNQQNARINGENARQQESQSSSPSPYRKGFSVRRQKNSNLTNQKQLSKKQTPQMISPPNTSKPNQMLFQSQHISVSSNFEPSDQKINPEYTTSSNTSKINNVNIGIDIL